MKNYKTLQLPVLIALAAACVWCIHAGYQSVVLHQGSFFNELVRPAAGDQFMRLALVLAFGLVLLVQAYINNRPSGKKEKTAQDQFSESDALYRAIVETSPEAILISDLDGRLIMANHRAALMNGVKDEKEIIGQNFYDFIAPDDRPHARENAQIVFATGILQNLEYAMVRKDGSCFPGELNLSIICDEKGNPRYFLRIIRDITQRKKAEEELRQQQHFLASMFSSIQDGISILDKDLIIKNVNPIMEKLYRHALPLIGKKCHSAYHGSDLPCAVCPSRKTLATGLAAYETSPLHDDRGAITGWLELYTFPLIDIASRELIGVIEYVRDITEKRKAEALIQQTQRMDSIGVLAGGIAHDFNNILTAILVNVSLAKINTAQENPLYEMLASVEKATFRARGLTQQLLTFSRGGTPVKTVSSLADLIRDACEFALHGSNVRCTFSFAKDLWPAEIDEGQITQVFHNLVINADQAMPEGGTIALTAENCTLAQSPAVPLAQGAYCKIVVSDTGIGIPAEYIQKIFDPYFTTKQKGTGLGLATTYSIIKKHNGFISVDSAPGKGTTFCIYLPALPHGESPAPQAAVTTCKSGAKILVMDDDETIRGTLGELFKSMGHFVTLADEGAQMLKIYEQALAAKEPFDLVILDLTVPGAMGGKEAMGHLLRINPNVKAIVSSGYAHDPIMAQFKKYGFCATIAKPYNFDDLQRVLQAALAG
ncbi:MAG: PAS domain S-box protein [Chitinivibrionales bacterium]|nr:PAS domain S-box protein [Chitinivibrionales bacterium]